MATLKLDIEGQNLGHCAKKPSDVDYDQTVIGRNIVTMGDKQELVCDEFNGPFRFHASDRESRSPLLGTLKMSYLLKGLTDLRQT